MKPNIENQIYEKLNRIISVLEEKQPFLSFEDARKYLCVSKSTLYKLTSNGEIRFYKPHGKLIYFSKTHLNDFITGRKPLKKTLSSSSVHFPESFVCD